MLAKCISVLHGSFQADDKVSGFIKDQCGNINFNVTNNNPDSTEETGPSCDLTCTNVEDATGHYESKSKKYNLSTLALAARQPCFHVLFFL